MTTQEEFKAAIDETITDLLPSLTTIIRKNTNLPESVEVRYSSEFKTNEEDKTFLLCKIECPYCVAANIVMWRTDEEADTEESDPVLSELNFASYRTADLLGRAGDVAMLLLGAFISTANLPHVRDVVVQIGNLEEPSNDQDVSHETGTQYPSVPQTDAVTPGEPTA